LGCSDTSLSQLEPRLEITAYEDTTTFYRSVDNDADVIDLGEVPVFARKSAFFTLSNPTSKPLTVFAVKFNETVGERWEDLSVAPEPDGDSRAGRTPEFDFDIPPSKTVRLQVPYGPGLEGEHSA